MSTRLHKNTHYKTIVHMGAYVIEIPIENSILIGQNTDEYSKFPIRQNKNR